MNTPQENSALELSVVSDNSSNGSTNPTEQTDNKPLVFARLCAFLSSLWLVVALRKCFSVRTTTCKLICAYSVVWLVVCTFFAVCGILALYQHPVACSAVESTIIEQYPEYYNEYCLCGNICTFPDCDDLTQVGKCCGPKCSVRFRSGLKPMAGICDRQVRYITQIRVVLKSEELENKTVNAYFREVSIGEYFTNTSKYLTDEYRCTYTVDDLGLGNTYTLHQGYDSGAGGWLYVIICCWIIFSPCSVAYMWTALQ